MFWNARVALASLVLALSSTHALGLNASERSRDSQIAKYSIDPKEIVSAPGFGAISGRIVISEADKNAIPEPKILFDAGKAPVSPNCCGAEDPIRDDSLIINPQNRGVKNVFIYLKDKPQGGRKTAASQSVWPTADLTGKKRVIEYDNCSYTPHAMILTVEEILTIRNHDPLVHGFKHNPAKNRLLGRAFVAAQDGKPSVFQVRLYPRPERYPVFVSSPVYTWMSAYQLPLDHPYGAVTDGDGRFIISDLPPGPHIFTIWHERAGVLNQAYTVQVSTDKTTEVQEISVRVSQFRKK